MKTMARAEDKAEIIRRLKMVRPECTRQWGRMSAHQMVCHLSDAFRLAMHQKPASPATGLFQATVIKWIALYFPLSWPPGVPTRPEMDQEIGGTPPGDFAADLAALEGLLEAVTTPATGYDWPAHPIFGTMSERAWLRWAYLHVDHHLRQFGL
jgi:Protein of unknown function (DUF1569)